MNCPVCKRELAPTLSICFTCGAMVNDSVREELETKIGRPAVPPMTRAEIPKFEPIKPWAPQPVKVMDKVRDPAVAASIPAAKPEPIKTLSPTPAAEPVKMTFEAEQPIAEAAKPKVITAKLKKQTSPTLVDFQPTNPTVPDWRLQLQNSIRKRNLEPTAQKAEAIVPEVAIVPKTAAVETSAHPSHAAVIQNEKLANAIKRIEVSKRTFGSGAAVGIAAAAQARRRKPVLPQRSFPFDVVERDPNVEIPAMPLVPATDKPKPQLVSPMPVEKKKFDTNKLPPIPEPENSFPLEPVPEPEEEVTEVLTKTGFDRFRIWNTSPEQDELENQLDTSDEIDDLAPFSMRFGAAVFDLIIASFGAGILLSPLLLSGSLGSTAGLLAIFGGWLVVMFAYFTGSIAYMGRTFGMRLFSIEMIDAEANELPTFHQAAVNSAAYLLSLMLFGLGFVPAFFNEERRAMHDLLSGTLLIREY